MRFESGMHCCWSCSGYGSEFCAVLLSETGIEKRSDVGRIKEKNVEEKNDDQTCMQKINQNLVSIAILGMRRKKSGQMRGLAAPGETACSRSGTSVLDSM